jgi:phytoene dehydrogenase-like protein
MPGKDLFSFTTINLEKECTMTDYQAIVIGSGAGGLSAALTLSRSGSSVLLLEAMPSFGGYLNPFRRKPYTFDTGLHYLGELGKGERFWSLLDTLPYTADSEGQIPEGGC